jgi:hypothetical protein
MAVALAQWRWQWRWQWCWQQWCWQWCCDLASSHAAANPKTLSRGSRRSAGSRPCILP